jgi:hypothetical protein
MAILKSLLIWRPRTKADRIPLLGFYLRSVNARRFRSFVERVD